MTMKNICLFACTHQTYSLITQVRMPVGTIVCHGRLIDTFTLNFVHFGPTFSGRWPRYKIVV
jgi:hypothetical protein